MKYIAEKLVHSSAETRGRALESLEFKWKYGLVAADDLLQDRRVLRSLLGLINLGDGIQTTAVALLLLRKIAAADTRLAKALLELGALQQLHASTPRGPQTAGQVGASGPTATAHGAGTQTAAAVDSPAPKFHIMPGVWPDELLPSVEALVSLLLSPSTQSSRRSTSLTAVSAAARADASSTHKLGGSSTAAAKLFTSRTSSSQSDLSHGENSSISAHDYSKGTEQQQQQRVQGTAATAAAGGPVHPVFGRLHMSALNSSSAAAAAVGDGDGSRPGTSHSSEATVTSSAAAAVATAAAIDSGLSTSAAVQSSGPATAAAPAVPSSASLLNTAVHPASSNAAAAAAGRAEAHAAEVPAAADGVGDTSSFDERLLRARARADWRQQEQGLPTARPEGPGSWPAVSASGSCAYGHISLPVVPLSAADDQVLFELNVRLQYSDDERLLLPALMELSGAVGLDMPAEALLQRQSILDNCLALVSSSRFSKAVSSAAASVLLQLINGLKLSLALAQHPELARSEYGDNAQPAAAAAAGKPRSSIAAAGQISSSSSVLAAARLQPGFEAAAKVLAAARAPVLDPTCPNSYPLLLLPESGPDTAWQLPLSVMEQQRVDVTAAVNSICLQVSELLSHPDRHYELLPILEAALPLLVAPVAALHDGSSSSAAGSEPSSNGSINPQQQQQQQQLSEELQAIWRGLLGAISRALASTAAVAAGDRATALASSLSGQQQQHSTAAGSAVVVLAAAGSSSALGVAGPGLWCWDNQSINLVQLTIRLLQAAPMSWCCSALVPPSLIDALAAAASDGVLDQLYPHLRQAATPYLQLLRPACLSILQAVTAVKAAAAAAEEAAGPLLLLLEQQPAAAANQWLRTVQQGIPGLGYTPRTDARMIKCFLHGLAVVAACYLEAKGSGSGSSSCGGTGGEADLQLRPGYVLLLLLSHQQQQVQQLVQQLLLSAIGPDTAAAGVQQLLMSPEISEHLIVQASYEQSSTQAWFSSLLLTMLNSLGYQAAAWLMPWRCWIHCCSSSSSSNRNQQQQQQQQQATQTSKLSEVLDAYVQQDLQQQQGLDDLVDSGFWGSPLVAVLQDLFSVSSGRRRAAGRQLLLLLMGKETSDLDETVDAGDNYADDLFKGLLDSHTPTSSSSSSILHKQQQQQQQYFSDPFTDSSANLAANFDSQDVTNLLAVLFNEGLAHELRRAAADELLALSPAPQLLDLMVKEETLNKMWELCVPQWNDDGSDVDSSSMPATSQSLSRDLPIGAGPPSGDIFDMQLPAAALQLLAALLARSPAAMQWMRKQPSRLLVPLLPLALHTLHSVRRATARLLALVLFGTAADQWTGFSQAAAAAAAAGSNDVQKQQQQQQQQRSESTVLLPPGLNAVLLPEPFLRRFKFPFRVLPVPVAAAAAADTDDAAQQQQQQQQQQYVIKQLVEQQQLLAAAGYDSAAARHLLQDCLPPTLQHISQHVLSTTANQLFNCDPNAVAQRLLAAVAAAESHPEAEQALRQLERLGSSQRGLQAIAAATAAEPSAAAAGAAGGEGREGISWESAFGRLLGVAPVTVDDQRLWLQLLKLVERMLAAAALTEVQYTYLQVLLQRSVTAWFQQPAVAKNMPRPPLALASGTNSWQLLRQQPSSAAAAAAAVADMLGIAAAGSSAEPSAAAAVDVGSSDEGLLAVQVSRQALRVLLQLISAVKSHCCLTGSSSSSSVVGCYSLAAMQPAELVHLLISKLIASGDNIDYCCKALAVAVVAEVTGALQDTARYSALTRSSSQQQQQQQQANASSASSSSSSSSSLTDEAGVLLDLLEPIITRVLMPVAGKQLPGFKGKALVLTSLHLLLLVVEGPLVPVTVWAPVWAAIGGTFWLSRLSRDREASIRCLALSLLLHLLNPAAAATQTLITTNWPDCVNRLVRVASDICEAYAVRAAAIRALTAAMVVPVDILQGLEGQQQGAEPQQQQQLLEVPPKKLHAFGLAPILQLDQVWCDVVPQLLLTWQQRPAGTVAAAAALAAAAVAAEPDGMGRRLLLLPGLAAAAVDLIRSVVHACDRRAFRERTSEIQQQQQQYYMQQLDQLQIHHDPSHSISRLLPTGSGLAAAAAAAAAADTTCCRSRFPTATLALQYETAALGAAAAAAQLLTLAAAPASSGGGLLLLPAAVQDVLTQVPCVLMQLMATVGNDLLVLTNSSSSDAESVDALHSMRQGGSTGAAISLLQQQLAAVQVSATAVLTSPLASLPEQQRQQQLLLLITQTDNTQHLPQASGKQYTQCSSSSVNDGSSSSSSRKGILAAVSNCLSHTACQPQQQLVLTQLLGLLMSDEAVAAAALDGSNAASSSSSKPVVSRAAAAVAAASADAEDCSEAIPGAVGSELCRELAALLPATIFTPSTAAADSTAEGPTVATPEGLVIIFALQNLLTHSDAAKTAAIEIGLHKLLMEAAQAMAAAVAAANADPGQNGSSVAAAAANGAGTTGRSRARWFSYTASNPSAAAAAARKTAAGKGAAAAAAAAGSISGAQKKVAGPKAVGSLRPSKNRKQQQPHKDDSIAAAVTHQDVESPSPVAVADAAADTAAADAQVEENNAAAAAAGGSSSKQRSATAATRSLNMRKLLMSVVLLRHLAFNCHNTQAALVGDGLVDVILRLWPLALNHLPLLLRNLLPCCYQARLAAAALGSPQCTLLQSTLALLLPPAPAPQPAGSSSGALAAAAAAAGNLEVVRTAAAALIGYASSDDGACYLIRAGSSFLNDAQKIIRWCLLGLKKEHERQQQGQVQQQRLVGLLQLLAVIAGRSEGQQAMLRSTVAPSLVDLLVDVLLLPQQQGGEAAAAAAALLLLRNLSFHADLRSPALANQQLLPLLLAAAECLQPGQQEQGSSISRLAVGDDAAVPQWAPLYGKPVTSAAAAASSSSSWPDSSLVATAAAAAAAGGGLAVPGASGNICCAVYAVSALWAMMYQGEKIKAVVRKIPKAAARLTAVRDHAKALLHNTAAGSSSSRNAVDKQDNSPVKDTTRVSDTPEKKMRKDVQGNSQQRYQSLSKPKGSVLCVEINGRSLRVDSGMLSVENDRGVDFWLTQLVDSCTAVLDIMENV